MRLLERQRRPDRLGGRRGPRVIVQPRLVTDPFLACSSGVTAAFRPGPAPEMLLFAYLHIRSANVR